MDLDGVDRRQVLALLAGAGAVGGGAYLLADEPELAETARVDEETARRLAEAHAPTLYYGAREQWFPTDPREYASEREGETVVDGFDALDGYSADARETDYPHPTVFYNAVAYPDSPLTCVQFWIYSAFDQFSTNFHWHDWEVLHVFLDRSTAETGEPVLFVASAHSRKVPNNEHLDPDPERASIISEVGSHSSTLGVNARPTTFQRTAVDGLAPDISNDPVEVVSGEASLPLAYGLPRDEGLVLPYAVPEYEGERLPEHDRLPNVRPEDLIADDLTVDTYAELANPPEGIPEREGDVAFVPDVESDASGDARYELVDIDAIRGIDDFTGPQLSFSFRVPEFAEDAIAGHLTSVGTPWGQPRFTNPATDISDPQHRAALADRYEPISAGGDLSRILGAVRQATGADEAPGNNGVALVAPSIETVALLESDPEAVPSFAGVLTVENPGEGDHRLTVNGAGMAPYSELLTHDGGTTRAGVEGAIPMSANEDAVKVRGETADGSSLAAVSLEDDFAGRVYDGRPPGEDGRFGVYAHRDGAYTAEIRDDDGGRAAVRVNPDAADESVDLSGIETGKVALIDYLVRFLVTTRLQAAVFRTGDAEGIDDVPTGRDVSDELVAETVLDARANAGDLVDGVDDAVEALLAGTNVTASDEDGDSPWWGGDDEGGGNGNAGDGNADPHDDNGDDKGEDDGDDEDDDGGDAERVREVVRSIDAALLLAVAARAAARDGRGEDADDRLETLGTRLWAVQRAIEERELPGELGALAATRAERMGDRVDAAIEAEL